MSQRLNTIDLLSQVAVVSGGEGIERSWTAWVFEESIRRSECLHYVASSLILTSRRICVIYRIVNMLIYFEPAAMCDMRKDLVVAPLPAKKQLWEAHDAVTWQVETERGSALQSTFGLGSNGDAR